MRFVLRWMLNTMLAPFAIALLFVAVAAPFAQTHGQPWFWSFYFEALAGIPLARGMWLPMILIGLLATVIGDAGRKRASAKRDA